MPRMSRLWRKRRAIDPDRRRGLGSLEPRQEGVMVKWVMIAGVLLLAGCGVPFVPLI